MRSNPLKLLVPNSPFPDQNLNWMSCSLSCAWLPISSNSDTCRLNKSNESTNIISSPVTLVLAGAAFVPAAGCTRWPRYCSSHSCDKAAARRWRREEQSLAWNNKGWEGAFNWLRRRATVAQLIFNFPSIDRTGIIQRDNSSAIHHPPPPSIWNQTVPSIKADSIEKELLSLPQFRQYNPQSTTSPSSCSSSAAALWP